MKKIFYPTLKDIFPLRKHSDRTVASYWYQTRLFNLTSIMVLSSMAMLLFGLMGFRNLFLGGMTLSGYCLYSYFRNRSFAQGLIIRRHFNKEAVERETLKINYEVINNSKTTIPVIKITDQFELSQKKSLQISLESMKGHQKRLMPQSVELDDGMGLKNFHTITVLVTDYLDLFPFRLEFEYSKDSVFVAPKIDEVDWLPQQGNPHSFIHGVYQEPYSGEGVEFLGVREYIPGDPIKKFNWKQIAKRDELIVNEFEKLTNAKILIFLERNLKVHYGKGANSTWELARDLALGIASKNLQSMNQVAILSEHYFSAFGQGTSFLKKLETELSQLELMGIEKSYQLEQQLLDASRLVGTTLVWISPLINLKEVEKGIERLKFLAMRGNKGLFIAMTGIMRMAKELDPQLVPYLKSLGDREKEARRTLSKSLQAIGIEYAEASFEFLGGQLKHGPMA